MEEMTSTATSTGAMPFNALTKILPRMARKPQLGATSPSTAPITNPMNILSIKLTLVYFCIIVFAFIFLYHS